jgi:hypothetical protein
MNAFVTDISKCHGHQQVLIVHPHPWIYLVHDAAMVKHDEAVDAVVTADVLIERLISTVLLFHAVRSYTWIERNGKLGYRAASMDHGARKNLGGMEVCIP